MTSEEKSKITDLNKCNFAEMNEYFKAQSEARKQMSKEEKQVTLHSNTCPSALKTGSYFSLECISVENQGGERENPPGVWLLHHGQPQGEDRKLPHRAPGALPRTRRPSKDGHAEETHPT